MLVELGLTVTLSIKMGYVSNPTLLGLIAPMLLTAISKRRAKLKAPVIFLAQLPFLHLTQAVLVVHTLLAPALQAPVQLLP